MKKIGGFFELELPHNGLPLHPKAYALSTGRACMMVMLRYLSPKRVYVPFYTCDAVLEPFTKLNIETKFYALDITFYPLDLPRLDDGEYLLWTNYFGVFGDHTNKIKKRFGKQVLLDDTHAFFNQGHIDYWSFTSARKYFGVPDGAFLYAPLKLDLHLERFKAISIKHGFLRRLGLQKEAYEAYRKYEQGLDCSEFGISEVSEGILRGVDISNVAKVRRRNFDFLHSFLGQYNQLTFQQILDVPFCYPFLPTFRVNREFLYSNEIFIPSLWSDIFKRNVDGFDFEKHISSELLPLPVDHRYTTADLDVLINQLMRAK